MKKYIIIVFTVFLSLSYMVVYENLLYELTYVSYLPDYSKHPYPTYDINGIKQKCDICASENINDYIPFYGKVLNYLYLLALVFTIVLIIPLFSLSIYFTFKNKKILDYKWIVIHILFYWVLFSLITKIELMD